MRCSRMAIRIGQLYAILVLCSVLFVDVAATRAVREGAVQAKEDDQSTPQLYGTMRLGSMVDQSQNGAAKRALKQENSQGPVYHVDPEELAVLPAGFERGLTDPWQSTTVPTANGLSSNLSSTLGMQAASFFSFSQTFANLLGSNPVIQTLAERDYEFAHEGPVWLPESDEVFFVSDRLGNTSTPDVFVELSAINLTSGEVRQIEPANPVGLANGAVAYQGGVAVLAQGHENDSPGGIVYLDPYTGAWEWLLNNWFGLDFNSPNDIVTTSDGALWFTDPSYGFNQGFKGKPQLGEYVYRFVPGGAPARVVADGFNRPNGLAFSADQTTMYVSDTGFLSGTANQPPNPLKPHTIYAFDIATRNGGQFLQNKRVFAVCDNGIPDGVKLDADGNVYSGCGDGVNVWNPAGDLIGKIEVSGGVSNFCFAGNTLIMLAETKVLTLQLQCSKGCTS